MKLRKLLPLPTFLLLSIFLTTSAFAQSSLGDYYLKGSPVTSGNITLAQFLSPIIKNASLVAGMGAFLVMILAGFKYISAGDNEKEIKNAGSMLTYSLVGLVLAVMAFFLTQLLLGIGGAGKIFSQ